MIAHSCRAQKSVMPFVRENSKVMHSLSFDGKSDDLQPVGDAIGSARIVMLGEQSHGDGSAFLVKSRLVKYLHEVKGFDVLAFEGDFYSLTHGWPSVAKDSASIRQFLRQNIYPVWSFSNECKELLYQYLPETYRSGDSLQIAGIDPQLHGAYTGTHLKKSLQVYFKRHQAMLESFKPQQQTLLNLVDSVNLLNVKTRPYLDSLLRTDFKIKLVHFRDALNVLCEQLADVSDPSGEYRAMRNLGVFASELLQSGVDGSAISRDEMMSENLKWLITHKFQSEKVIVWAANTHIMKNAQTAFKNPSVAFGSMGTRFTRDSSMAKQVYVLGITSGTGWSRTIYQKNAFEIPRAKRGFESWFDPAMQYGFLDFRQSAADPIRDTFFKMKARGHSAIEARWLRIFDGIVYIREMQPAHLIEK